MRMPITDLLTQPSYVRRLYLLSAGLYLFFHSTSFRAPDFQVIIKGRIICVDEDKRVEPQKVVKVYVKKNKEVHKMSRAEFGDLFYEPALSNGKFTLEFRAMDGSISTLIFVLPDHKPVFYHIRPETDKTEEDIGTIYLEKLSTASQAIVTN